MSELLKYIIENDNIDNINTNSLSEYALAVNILPKSYRVFSEFSAYIKRLHNIPISYIELLNSFMTLLGDLYAPLKTLQPVLVNVEKYDIGRWGRLYWSFLHYSSILIQYANYTGIYEGLGGLHTLIYNIDVILPCGMCAAKYASIKHTPIMKHIVENMCYGYIALSVYHFHVVISKHIDKIKQYTPNMFLVEYGLCNLVCERPHIQIDYIKVPTILCTEKYSVLLAILTSIFKFTNNAIIDMILKRMNNISNTDIINYYAGLNKSEHENELLLYVNNNTENSNILFNDIIYNLKISKQSITNNVELNDKLAIKTYTEIHYMIINMEPKLKSIIHEQATAEFKMLYNTFVQKF